MTRNPLRSLSALVLALSLAPGAAMADEPTPATEPHTNRLINETSPYLLQHAHNPVDWYPWGPEAFEAARERQVPILLSVGYSTCYWCHVMERECFENPEIAGAMNKGFVCIKVDREERPDVDDIYMTALQLLTHSGGWPMNMFLTPPGAEGEGDPGLKPFYGGTYFPPERRGQMSSFPQLLNNITNIWTYNRAEVLKQAEDLTEAVRISAAKNHESVRIDQNQISQAYALLTRSYDQEAGGFGAPPQYAPKFPQPSYLEFFLDTMHTLDDPAIRDMVNAAVRHTLDAMALGGIHDHVGGGFHRYATDRHWVVPHFEKMLYDNAELASLYAKAYMLGGDPLDKRVVRDVLDYVLRDMTGESGLFYSAQDAEVNGREGQNYLWTWDQLVDALGEEDAEFAADIYSVSKEGGNFTDPHHPEDDAKNILVLRARPDALAEQAGMELDAFLARKQAIDETLDDARRKRDQPRLDDKVLTGWNGLMIAGLADGAMALGSEEYLDAAEKAAKAVLINTRDDDGVLLRTSRHGVAKTPAFLEDYAYLIKGLLALHRANAASGRADLTYINAANDLTEKALAAFTDDSGALYDTRPDQSDLILRTRSIYDGALPSPVSVMLHDLLDLYELTKDEVHLRHVVEIMKPITSEIRESPVGTINSVRALYRLLLIDPTSADLFGPVVTKDEQAEAGAGPVRIFAAADRVQVPETGIVELPVRIEVGEGFHINAHEPGVEGLIPLDVRIQGSEAVHLEVDYPEGEPYAGQAVPAGAGTLRVHSGAVELTLRLSRTGQAWTGRPLILVTYQVCTESECLRPRTVELDVAIDQ